jgi:hypothetical protein
VPAARLGIKQELLRALILKVLAMPERQMRDRVKLD